VRLTGALFQEGGMSFPAFDHPWYAEIIERFSPEFAREDGRHRGAFAVARCLLAASCVLAQAVDRLADEVKKAAEAR
jgi:hypothetical protein